MCSLVTMTERVVTTAKQQALELRMQALGIREADLIEQFIRGAGHGGQKINKTSSTVYLKHIPSGTEVRCQQSRSRALNRWFARCRLVDKLEAERLGAQSAIQQKIAKLQRQKRKRSKRAQEKVLKFKREQSERKQRRQKPIVE